MIDSIRDFLESILDAILPPRERSARTKGRTIEEIPLSPTSHDLLGGKVTTIMEYQDAIVQDLIRSLKYDGSGHAAHLAGSALADYLREEIASVRSFSPRPILLVPVPLHPSRFRERGFNQIELVLRALPKEFKDGTLSSIAPQALSRAKATPPQTRLARAQRIKNVSGAFAVLDKDLVRSAYVFLIDDVTTTGATLINAGAPLKRSGAEIAFLALARA
jgi:competence protein ComFC